MSGSELEDRSLAKGALQTVRGPAPIPEGPGIGDPPVPNAAFGFFLISGTIMVLALIVILWLSELLVYAGSR